MNKFKITTEIRAILRESSEITALVGENISPLVSKKGTVGDFITYQRDGYKQEHTKMGVSRQIPIVYVNAVSDDYDRSQDLASLIYEALEGTFTDPDMRIHLEDSAEDYEDGKYIQVLQFSIE